MPYVPWEPRVDRTKIKIIDNSPIDKTLPYNKLNDKDKHRKSGSNENS